MRLLVLMSTVAVSAACGLPLPGSKCTPVGPNNGGTSAPGCVPDGGAPAGQALKLELIDTCRASCGVELNLKCDVVVDAGTVALSLSGDICTPLSMGACPAICKFTRFPCDVPALAAGTYTVLAPGQPGLTLVVGDGGSETTCTASPF